MVGSWKTTFFFGARPIFQGQRMYKKWVSLRPLPEADHGKEKQQRPSSKLENVMSLCRMVFARLQICIYIHIPKIRIHQKS